MDKVAVWEATKRHYANMRPQDSLVIDELDIRSSPTLYDTKVAWYQADCIDIAIGLKEKDMNPLLLNMASDFQPGGGVWKGASAQEEELFRRSNYFKFLHKRWYPFPPFRTILSRGVEFYRDSRYALITPVRIDCVAVAGLRRPERTADRNRFARPQDAETLLKKLRILFQVAANNGNDSLVLSALGCGAFQGPVQHIAELFRLVVEENRGRFKEIAFAILGENYGLFKRAYLTS